jgi:hypothetical protein
MSDQYPSGGPEPDLPTFSDIRFEAYGLLGDVDDVLRSDWRRGHGPTPAQAEAVREARRHIALAKDALNRAAE